MKIKATQQNLNNIISNSLKDVMPNSVDYIIKYIANLETKYPLYQCTYIGEWSSEAECCTFYTQLLVNKFGILNKYINDLNESGYMTKRKIPESSKKSITRSGNAFNFGMIEESPITSNSNFPDDDQTGIDTPSGKTSGKYKTNSSDIHIYDSPEEALKSYEAQFNLPSVIEIVDSVVMKMFEEYTRFY